MKRRTRDQVKLASETILFLSLAIASITGLLKMPILANGLSEDLYQYYQRLPWGFLNPLHDWSGVLAVGCVVVHLALVWRRYFWLLRHLSKRNEEQPKD